MNASGHLIEGDLFSTNKIEFYGGLLIEPFRSNEIENMVFHHFC